MDGSRNGRAVRKRPSGVYAKAGAAAILKSTTAHYLCHSTRHVQKGDRVIVHAGAGCMGLLLPQMIKKLGGYVFTTVSTEEKAELSKGAGADQVILYTQQDFAATSKANHTAAVGWLFPPRPKSRPHNRGMDSGIGKGEQRIVSIANGNTAPDPSTGKPRIRISRSWGR